MKRPLTPYSGIGIFAVLCLFAGFGCSTADVGMAAPPSHRDESSNRSAAERRTIEESDIYRVDGDYLYIQNSATGLNVIDVANPEDPQFITRTEIANIEGQAGELYIREGHVFILFEMESQACQVTDTDEVGTSVGRTLLVTLNGAPNNPQEASRHCMPGRIAASRLVGDTLYVSTHSGESDWGNSGTGTSWVLSYDVSDLDNIRLADVIQNSGRSVEIHATNTEIYLAQAASDADCDSVGSFQCTQIRYIDIADMSGALVERGSISVTGDPAGRFHMDAYEGYFRIVTHNSQDWDWTLSNNLHVIDVRDPDNLEQVGEISEFAENEELHATKFVGNRAYIVTYEVVFEFTDPLWVVSLDDPTNPEILSELEVPGWSDYVFPMGNRLAAVGRGDQGDRVAVALFDISDPYNTSTLSRIEFGAPDAESETNIDFRGVSILHEGFLTDEALLIVPYTDPYESKYGCFEPAQVLQFFELGRDEIVTRGSSEQFGVIRRSTVVGDFLYSISDEEVSALDVSNPSSPESVALVTVGDGSQVYRCTAFGDISEGCNMSSRNPGGNSGILIVALGFIAIVSLRRLR